MEKKSTKLLRNVLDKKYDIDSTTTGFNLIIRLNTPVAESNLMRLHTEDKRKMRTGKKINL
jgi:hypothetical protein